MRKKEQKKTKWPSLRSAATSPQEPPVSTEVEATDPQVLCSEPAHASAGADDNPWRRFLALGKGLPADNTVASAPVLNALRYFGTNTPAQSSPSSPAEYGAASGCAAGTGGSDRTKTKPYVAQMWISDGTWSLAVAAASVALMAMMFLYAAWMLNGAGTFHKEERLSMTVCSNDDCNLHAASLMDAIDRSVQPCDDFEAFACGRLEPPSELRSFDTRLKRHWHVIDANLMLTRGRNQPPRFEASRKATAMLQACLWRGSLHERRLGRQVHLLVGGEVVILVTAPLLKRSRPVTASNMNGLLKK
ncbi:hypothetical protein HPB49_022398 [Dermacentor silvarum]|uniref:Uncharacterized protein n=1 Tax=Dermacentor silvarum TaxID=543639 RepID=A0ACB8CT37_DERSI|nr:hypothetical protein HPB49_022398 [Dermacentor silvarum]